MAAKTQPQVSPLESLNVRAKKLYEAGQYDAAAATFNKVMAIQNQRGEKPYDTLIWLGRIQLRKKNIPAATSLWAQSLEMREVICGPQDDMVSCHRRRVASLYVALKQPAQAVNLFKRAVTVARKSDPLCSEVMEGLNDLVAFYTQFKMHELAVSALREELVLREAKKGIHDRETANCRDQLALLYCDLKRPQDAVQLYDTVIAKSKPNSDDQANAISQKAYFFVSTNKLPEAADCYRQAIAIRLPKLGTEQENRKRLLGNLKSLSRLTEKMGNLDDADAVNKQLLEVADRTRNFDVELDATRHYVSFLWRHKRMQEADVLMKRELELDFFSHYMRMRRVEFLIAIGKRKMAAALLLEGADLVNDKEPWVQAECLAKLESLNIDVKRLWGEEKRLAVLAHGIENSVFSSDDLGALESGAKALIRQGKAAVVFKLLKNLSDSGKLDIRLNNTLVNIRLAAGDVAGARRTLQEGLSHLVELKKDDEEDKHRDVIQIPLEFMISGSSYGTSMDFEGGVYHQNVEFGGDYTVPGAKETDTEERSETELLEFPIKRYQREIVDRGILKSQPFGHNMDMYIEGKQLMLSVNALTALYKLHQARILIAEGKKEKALKLYPKVLAVFGKEKNECKELTAKVSREFQILQRLVLSIKPTGLR